MLWSELSELEDCELCPLLSEGICSGGISSSPSGVPIEPPCCSFSPDTDLEEWVSNYYEYERRERDEADKARKKKEEKDRKNKISAARRRYSNNYCVNERIKLKRLKRRLQSIESSLYFASSLHEAFSFADVVMSGYGKVEKYEVPERTQNEIQCLRKEIEKAETDLKAKQKECRSTEYYIHIADLF